MTPAITTMPHNQGRVRRPRTSRVVIRGLMLCLYFLLTLIIARANSITVDEGLHIASGYTILRTGDYRLVEEHPPLTKLWLALPLLPLRDLPHPATLPAWEEAAHPTTESLPLLHMAEQLLYPHQPIDTWLFPSRVMNALLGVLLLAVLTRWSLDHWGTRSAAFLVILATCDPNLLAHGAVAGTDIGATLFILLGLYAGTRFLQHPTRKHALLTGCILGLALTTKLTAALLGPVLGIAGLYHVWQAIPEQRRHLIRHGLLLIAISALTFWAVYSFQIGDVPGIPIPLPAAAHAIPFLRLQEHTASGHQAFFLGENSMTGWPTYFPVAFLLKTPLPALILAVYNVIKNIHKSAWRIAHSELRIEKAKSCILHPASLFSLIYIIISLTSTLNIGYRHLLPLIPLLYLGIGYGIEKREKRKKYPHSLSAIRHSPFAIRYLLFAILLLWQLLSLTRVYPYPLGFFNELAGGPKNGWRYLADSNTDWGQGYTALAQYQQAHAIDNLNLSAFIFHDPANYGINYTPLTPMHGDTPAIFPSRFSPPPGDYAISRTPLDGIPLADPEMYDWFRWRAPDDIIAHALHIYHVKPEESAIQWVAQCITPTTPLNDEQLLAGFGQLPTRHITFDCSQSWLIPSDRAGRYILHGTLLEDTRASCLHTIVPIATDTFIEQRLEETEIVYRQRTYRDAPAFAIYAPAADAPLQNLITTVWAQPAGAPPATFITTAPLTGPPALEGGLNFLGINVYAEAQTLDVETWWQVNQTPPERALSIMAHLLTQDGTPVAVQDGLGIAPQLWHTDDILIQRHTFPTAHDQTYILRTGIYWLDDGSRWQIQQGVDNADALFILLEK